MKMYEFRAGTSKDDMIMGLGYPAAFMIPALLILLVLEAVFPHENITAMATLNIFVEAVILFPSLIIGRLLAIRLKRKCGHDFKMQTENKKITLWMDDKKVFVDTLKKILIKENAEMLKLSIYGTEKNMVIIGRGERNPFGFCREEDLSELRKLAAYLQEISCEK